MPISNWIKTKLLRLSALACLGAIVAQASAHAVELKVSSAALERTMQQQLFATPDGRHYLRGDAHSACSVYAESPQVSFAADRVMVHLRITAKLGSALHGQCLGLHVTRDVDVSLLPEAEGESIGFRDARIEKLSGSRELDLLLMPFLARKVPSSLQVNAADQIRKVLARSAESTGYGVTLDTLKIHSMDVEGSALVLDVDAGMSVQ